MASVEEVAILIVEGQSRGFADVQAKIQAADQQLAQLTSDYRAGAVSLDDYTERGARLRGELEGLRAAYKTADDAVKKYGSAQAASAALQEKASTAGRQYQQQVTGLSYALNDFFGASGGWGQRLNAIANNLPMLLSGFGGLGLALSGIVPIIALVITNWEHLKRAIGLAVEEGVDHLENLKKKIKELEDKPVKLAVDVQELERARLEAEGITRALQAAESFRKLQGTFERESGQQVRENLQESDLGAEGVFGKLREAEVRKLLNNGTGEIAGTSARIRQVDEQIRRQEELADVLMKRGAPEQAQGVELNLETLRKHRSNLQDRLQLAQAEVTKKDGIADVNVGNLIRNATEGSGQALREGQGALAAALSAAGLGGLAGAVRASSPEELRAQEEADQELERSIAAQRDGARARAEAAKQEKRQAGNAEEDRKAVADIWRKLDESTGILKKPEKFQGHKDPAVARLIAQEDAAMKAGGFVEHSAADLARLRGMGVPDDRAFALVQSAASRDLKRLFPRMGAEQRGDFATKITATAAGQQQRRLQQLQAQGYGAIEQTQAIVAETQRAVANLSNQLQRIGQRNRHLQSNARALTRQAREHQGTALNFVGP